MAHAQPASRHRGFRYGRRAWPAGPRSGPRAGVDVGVVPELAATWADVEQSAEIVVSGKMIGTINRIIPKIAKSIGVKKETVVAEMNLSALSAVIADSRSGIFKEYEKFPPATRDISFVVDQKVLYSDVRQEINSYSKLISDVELSTSIKAAS